MTYRDSMAFSLDEAQRLIDELTDREHDLAEARRSRDRRMRSDAEAQTGQLRRQLLDQEDASSLYLYLSATGAADSEGFRTEWQQRSLRVDVSEELRQWAVEEFFREHWSQSEIDLTRLPAYSFSVHFAFTLAQPYLSRDDNSFYIIDNPIVRDKVFRLPLVRPSSWKGNLRATLWQLGHRHDGEKYKDESIQHMFGETRGDDTGQAGRLIFFPSFFTKTGLEIINPHDRTRRVGKNPILFESVPIGAAGRFTLLYVPFDRVGTKANETAREVAADLRVLATGLQAMFCLYGFGAKTSSGFGLAQEAVCGGTLTLRATGLQDALEPSPAPKTAPDPSLPRYLEAVGRLHADLRAADGSLVSGEAHRELIESRGQKYAKKDRQLYEKAKAWWEREGRGLAEQGLEPELEAPAPPPAPIPAWPSRCFSSFDELLNLAERVAQQLTQGGDQ